MNTRSFSNDPPELPPQGPHAWLRAHLIPVLIGISVLALAVGVHLAAKALVAVAIGHLLIVGGVVGAPALRRHLRGDRGSQ